MGNRLWVLTRAHSSKTSVAMKLRNLIDAKAIPYGSTDDGKAWCVKALHPADAVSSCVGIPDHSNFPSVHMHYESVQTIACPDSSVGAWGLDMAVTPHPVSFSWLRTSDSSGDHTAVMSHLNPQLDAGITHTAKYTQWKSVAQKWRCTYAAVTVRLDAAAVSNQGTLVACQAPVEFTTVNVMSLDPSVGNPGVANIHGIAYTESDVPDFDRVQSMPQAYHGQARDGAYLPIKLDGDHRWVSEANEVVNWGQRQYNVGSGTGWCGPSNTAAGSTFPFEGLTCPYFRVGSVEFYGDATSPICNSVQGQVCLRNLDLTSRVSVTYRYGFELQVQPGSLLSPQQRLSPAFDARALETYNAISRELADAYPEEYNSLGKFWDVLKTVGRAVLPAIAKNIPIVGDVISVVSDVAGGMRANTERAAKALESGNPSLADVERVRAAVRTRPVTKKRLATAKKSIAARK